MRLACSWRVGPGGADAGRGTTRRAPAFAAFVAALPAGCRVALRGLFPAFFVAERFRAFFATVPSSSMRRSGEPPIADGTGAVHAGLPTPGPRPGQTASYCTR